MINPVTQRAFRHLLRVCLKIDLFLDYDKEDSFDRELRTQVHLIASLPRGQISSVASRTQSFTWSLKLGNRILAKARYLLVQDLVS